MTFRRILIAVSTPVVGFFAMVALFSSPPPETIQEKSSNEVTPPNIAQAVPNKQILNTPKIVACVHWVKTVDREGLDSTAQELGVDYCEKPDKVVVDKSISSKSGASYHRPQIASEPSKAYTSQAMSYLGRCYKWSNVNECMEEQDKFVRQYVNALAGDYRAQKDIADALTVGQSDDDPNGGAVIPNKLQACAWRQVIAASGSPYLTSNDQSSMVLDCDGLRPMDIETAKGRAHSIAHIITTAHVRPIAVPELEYDPKSGKDETQDNQN